jgi:squalene-associated FAD-dependent desaturase
LALQHITIVGAGWAGLSAAVAAVEQGWQVTLYEASALPGGRARALPQTFAGLPLDNGQHILIGAYQQTLQLMRTVGVEPEQVLQRLPLDLRDTQGQGLHLPDWPAPLNVLAGIYTARGWTWHDKTQLLKACWQWQRMHFDCDPDWTVQRLNNHAALSDRVITQLIEPLCLSALNTPMHQASGRVFLRVLHDALLTGPGSSDLLIPRVDLAAVFPNACLSWLQAHGAIIYLGHRCTVDDVDAHIHAHKNHHPVLIACPSWEAARLVTPHQTAWAQQAQALATEAITTVYLECTDPAFRGLPRPMVALTCNAQAPAQFVFDRGLLNGQKGLLAAVVSASQGTREEIAQQVRQQVTEQLGVSCLEVVQTVVEKRATLACTPGMKRPSAFIAPGLWACGDYVDGPYPSTLEGAVRSGQQVIAQIRDVTHREGLRLGV